jgi:fanconi-associated nuclease 1
LYKLDRDEIRYPPYEINKKTIVFPKRENLILFEDSCNLESELISLVESKSRDKIVHNLLPLIQSNFDSLPNSVIEFDQNLASYLKRFTAGHVLVRSLSYCVSVLEQLKMYTQACSLLEKLLEQKNYCQDYRGRWFERLILNLNKHLKKPDDAIRFLKSALDDNEVRGGHRYSIYQRARKVYSANKLTFPAIEEYHFDLKQISIFGSVLKEGIEKRKFIFVAQNFNGGLDMLNVEEVALRHYQSFGFISGVHCEGIIFHTFFGLLFWDIIYLADQSTQDAFHSPFQSIPLDLNSDYFYSRRYSLIQPRLELIRSMSKSEMIEMIETNWYKYEGCLSLVDWERCSITLLQVISLKFSLLIFAN